MVYLAPNLISDGYLSMELYLSDLASALDELGFSDYAVLNPTQNPKSKGLQRQWDRYVEYPLHISRSLRREEHLHVIDHSYGHLCHFHRNNTVTCHDIAEYRLSKLRSHQLYLWKKRVEGMKSAKNVTAISENTKRDIIELLGIPEYKITLNYYGHNPAFSQRSIDRQSLANQYGLSRELERGAFILLHVGSNLLRKNMNTLLSGISMATKEGKDLILMKVGHSLHDSEYSIMMEELGISERVRDIGTLGLDGLVDAYHFADAFAFPSTYEGFGRPIIEAQGCGCPVILSSSSCLKEIGGDAALYHEPYDAADLYRCICHLMEDKGLIANLQEKGLRNVKRFSWRRHAELLLESIY